MTIKEFFESKDKLAIHCNTKEKAKKLLKAFDRAGHCWVTGGCYIEDTAWEIYEEETCYNNTGCYGSTNYFKECHYTIFEFEEIELEDASLESRMEEVDDLISRQVVLKELNEYILNPRDVTAEHPDDIRYYNSGLYTAIEAVTNIPPVHTEQKIGKWEMDKEGNWYCSECGLHYDSWASGLKYCPNCGTKM